MITHKRLQAGEKPCKCNICTAAFSKSGGLNRA